jgi:hypothetical protein
MHRTLKKIFLVGLPLMSLLLVSPAVFAYHDQALDQGLEDDWSRSRDEPYGYNRPYDDDSYDRYGYDEGRRYEDEDSPYDRYGRQPYDDPSEYGSRPPYGDRPYPNSSSPDPSSAGPSSILPSLLDQLLSR